jgi:hypothetical protein
VKPQLFVGEAEVKGAVNPTVFFLLEVTMRRKTLLKEGSRFTPPITIDDLLTYQVGSKIPCPERKQETHLPRSPSTVLQAARFSFPKQASLHIHA